LLFKYPGDILIWFVVFLFSLSFHEAAHAWTSYRFGDDTGRLQGRISLNPIVHIDPLGTILFPLMGFMGSGFMMFGWAKPVQTNPLLWREKKKANIWVSAAGPISNFILATASILVVKALVLGGLMRQPFRGEGGPFNLIVPAATDSSLLMPIATMLSIFILLNVTLGVFNLFPIPPLDGSHVLEELLPPQMATAYEQIRPFGFILLFALMWATPVFGWIFSPILRFVGLILFG
jgi:Zn-dependent protease